MKSNKTIFYFVLPVIMVPVTLYAISQWYGSQYQRLPVLGPEKHIVGNFNFEDQLGQNVNQDYWKDKIVVAGYFFTSCPSVCPKVIYQLQRVRAYAAKNVLICSFTVDPERDSVVRLRGYAENHGIKSGWLFLTGDKISLYKFARTDLMIDATDGDGGPGDFIHSDKLVLIDPLRQIRGYYSGTDEADINRMMQDINKLNKEFNL